MLQSIIPIKRQIQTIRIKIYIVNTLDIEAYSKNKMKKKMRMKGATLKVKIINQTTNYNQFSQMNNKRKTCSEKNQTQRINKIRLLVNSRLQTKVRCITIHKIIKIMFSEHLSKMEMMIKNLKTTKPWKKLLDLNYNLKKQF